jgi:hypothetical protein
MKSVSNSVRCIYMLTTVFIMSNSSCQKNSNSYYVSLNDSIQHAIRSYTAENNISTKSRVITTEWIVNPYRTDVYISNTFRQFLTNPDLVPSYYSIISDSIVVLVYTGTETELARNTQDIQREIANLLNESGIRLQSDKRTTTHVKTWLYSSCSSSSATLVREPSTRDLLYIPCRDSDN